MNRRIKIERLRIRVPAGQTTAPKSLAADVAGHLAAASQGWPAGKLDAVRAKVAGGGVSGDTLARSISESVHGSLHKGGRRS
jgi:hypothetical protein